MHSSGRWMHALANTDSFCHRISLANVWSEPKRRSPGMRLPHPDRGDARIWWTSTTNSTREAWQVSSKPQASPSPASFRSTRTPPRLLCNTSDWVQRNSVVHISARGFNRMTEVTAYPLFWNPDLRVSTQQPPGESAKRKTSPDFHTAPHRVLPKVCTSWLLPSSQGFGCFLRSTTALVPLEECGLQRQRHFSSPGFVFRSSPLRPESQLPCFSPYCRSPPRSASSPLLHPLRFSLPSEETAPLWGDM